MKTKPYVAQLNDSENANSKLKFSRPQLGKLWNNRTLLGAAAAGILLTIQPASASPGPEFSHPVFPSPSQKVGDIFVIALENHNFTQPNPTSGTQQILGNPAAPYINSLITPGNPNAAQVSYATAYYNSGTGIHPSEPNYVWAEAGSDFGFHSDADPSVANGNKFYDNSPYLISQLTALTSSNTLSFWHFNYTAHLTAQLNASGIPWKNYQEDVQLSTSPIKSVSGTNGPVNPYNGTTQYNYAVKHNPMAFFDDTAFENVYPLAQLFADLNNNTVGKYNWITPDQYNEQHSSLTGGFTYHDVQYTGDQSAIAAGDNFLSIVIPEIMASKAYKNNGVIILWWDETEGGDTTSYTLPEIIISPLAKGNAYASSVPMNHSSDVKTMEEIFNLPAVNNPIPATETNVDCSFNNVATVNDLSDLFMPGVIPDAPDLSVTSDGFVLNHHTQNYTQIVHIKNNGNTPVYAPLFLALDNLSSNATLANADGTTAVLAPLGSPYVQVRIGDGDNDGDDVLRPHETATVILEFLDPSNATITYDARVLNVTPAP